MPVIKLTQEGISKLRCPEDKRSVQVCDAQHPGLLLELRQSDRPTWYIRYKSRDTGKTRYTRLGHFPDLSLADAREKAKDVQAQIRLGSDPRAEEDAKKAVPTFSEFFEEQYMPHVRTRKRTAAKDEEYYRLRLKARYGLMQLTAIKKLDIQLFHSSLHDEGLAPATCNHYLKLMKRALNLAIQWEIIDGPCVAKGIEQYRELSLLENYMSETQVRDLVTVLKTDKNRTVCDIILFLLSTGARLNEALQARWGLIDVERRVWRIPATNSKSGKVRAVPLNDTALAVLSKQDTEDEFEHVFINRQTGLPYTTVQKVWDRLRRKAGLGHVRIHDLRHQYASMLVNSGRTLYEVQQILGHSTPKVTMRYSHLSTATLQSASASASDAINEAMKKAS